MDTAVDRQIARPYRDLPHVSKAVPLCGADDECLKEIYAVLERFGNQNRFGISLLHQHFPVYEGEILNEECNEDTRTLTIRPIGESEIRHRLQTNWRLVKTGDGVEALGTCECIGCTMPHPPGSGDDDDANDDDYENPYAPPGEETC